MSQTGASFEALTQALRSLYQEGTPGGPELRRSDRTLVLSLPTDVAAFSVFNGTVQDEFDAAYSEFKHLYRENHQEWDRLTLSFVVCRLSESAQDDRFYATLEHDPLFCRKYVIRAFESVSRQREELLRLPFLPLPDGGHDGLQRPQSAQDLLQSAGLSASFARKLIETGHRSPERIVSDLRDGTESLPARVERPDSKRLTLTKPRSTSRLLSATVEGFRAYRKTQEFDLNASVIVLYGPNGLGKTSFFDAIDFACTGRIGRLCRHQQRNQAEFSRLATHLDKTPGTGSVVLNGRTDEVDSQSSQWTLKRATGDWSTAWVDGEERDRKGVLSFLTHANWLESRPRQQTYESLFRATHLFGQDEQELLIEFRKGSVIPEEFISEMLALQDYSQGLAKVKSVVGELTAELATLQEQLTSLQIQATGLADSIPDATKDDASPSEHMAIDDLVDDLRKRLSAVGLADSFPLDNVSLQALEQWSEVVTAQGRAAEERAALAAALVDQMPEYRRLLDEMARRLESVSALDQQMQLLTVERRECETGVKSHQDAQSQQEVQQKQLEQRRNDLRAAHEAIAKRTEALRLCNPLRDELKAQQEKRAALDGPLATTESELSQAMTANAEATRNLATGRADLDALNRAIESYPSYEKNVQDAVDMRNRIAQAVESVQSAERLLKDAQNKAREAKASREVLLPKYERAVESQAELDRLLDSIQTHVHDAACPLCGSEFESVSALLGRISQRRRSVQADQDVTRQYKDFVAKEAEWTAQVGTLAAKLSLSRTTLSELRQVAEATGIRIEEYVQSYYAVMGNRESEVTKNVLIARHTAAAERLKQAEDSAAQARRKLLDLTSAKESYNAQRVSINERARQLEQNIQKLNDQNSELSTVIQKLLEHEGITEAQIEAASVKVAQLVEESRDKIQLLERKRKEKSLGLENVKRRESEVASRRAEMLSQLEKLREAVVETRNKLGSIGVANDVDIETLKTVASDTNRRANQIRETIDKAQVIIDALRARDTRLQIAQKQGELEAIRASIAKLEAFKETNERNASGLASVEKLLKAERQGAIEKHIAAYGPLITNIQQRLRSVYGFGGVQLLARGGEAAVQVEWRNRSVQVPPTDFFSDSQKQILMLSIFLAGGLRQNWSGFAPVLLDDPVTHFDDLNAYGFVELIRGIISSHPNAWQFIISTCEDRLFALMQKKFARVAGGAVFYEYLGMSDGGPIIERR